MLTRIAIRNTIKMNLLTACFSGNRLDSSVIGYPTAILIAFLITALILLAGCVSSRPTPTPAPLATLPLATGIPVTPKSNAPRAQGAPTATVETLPTPLNVAELFSETSRLLASYQPPDTDPQPLYDALAQGIGEFLMATANGDVSLEGQPALEQLRGALGQLENLPDNAAAQVTAIHVGDDQGGSRDLVFVAMQGVMGMPVIGLERLGASYERLAPVSFEEITTPDARYFYAVQLEARDVTGDDRRELLYVMEYPGASGTTDELTVARWREDEQDLHTIFHAALINWAGESDYHIETTADAASIKLTFPWFGAFDHKLLAHPNATQTWEYDDAQDKFVQVSQSIEEPTTQRQALNVGEYAFRNGDLQGALALFERASNDATLEKEDFGESKANPAAFAKFRQAMVLDLMGRTADSKKLLSEVQKSGDALASVATTYAKNSAGTEGALRGWIAMANAGDLYQLIYESKAGNLDFPFEASEIYAQGGIVSSFLNTHADADKNPEAVWGVLDALGLKPLQHAAADLNGDGVNEFLVVLPEGGTSPNQAQSLWFVYKRENFWRVRSIDLADTVRFEGPAVTLPNSQARALKLKLPEAYTPNETALTWDGTRIIWLDAKTLEPRADEIWTTVGGGVLEDDF